MAEAAPIELTVPCASCGPVSLPLSGVVLWLTGDDTRSWLTVCCPACGSRFVHHTAPGEHLLLLACEVPTRSWTAPVERIEEDAPHEPVTHAELLTFAEALASSDAVTALLPPAP
jgi:hypothetical protein